MRLREMFLAEMSHGDAVKIFLAQGINAASMDPAELKAAYRKKMISLHPDRGGDSDTAKMFNAAYDVLKNKPSISGRSNRSSSGPSYQDQSGSQYRSSSKPTETPPWAWAGYSGGLPPNASIYRENYTDVNYIKKRMWELSGHSKEEWNVQGYDGSFFRGSFTVYGSQSILKEMSKAMVDWQTKGGNPYQCRAVFVSNKELSQGKPDPYDYDQTVRTLLLTYLDGHFLEQPVEVEYSSFNRNPGNDQQFTRKLPGILDGIRDRGFTPG